MSYILSYSNAKLTVEKPKGNQEWTIQKNWQHWAQRHKTKTKQNNKNKQTNKTEHNMYVKHNKSNQIKSNIRERDS